MDISRIEGIFSCSSNAMTTGVKFRVQLEEYYFILYRGKNHFTLLIVNNSKSLKLNLLIIFTVQIAKECIILLCVVLMQSQSSSLHKLSLFSKITFIFRSNPEAMYTFSEYNAQFSGVYH